MEENNRESAVVRVFGSSSELVRVQETGSVPTSEQSWWKHAPMWAYVAAGALIVLGGFGIVAGGAIPTSGTALSEADQTTFSQLRADTLTAEQQLKALPDVETAQRALTTAQEAAVGVATVQNDYRILAADTVARGAVDQTRITNGVQNMDPYFASSVSADAMGPWFLLQADALSSTGTGIPELFASGFSWRATIVSGIRSDGIVPVTWVAEANSSFDSGRVVLAFAQADFDPIKQVFSNLTLTTTKAGNAVSALPQGE